MLSFELRAAFVDYRVQPSVDFVLCEANLANSETEQLPLPRAAGEAFTFRSLDTSRESVRPRLSERREAHAAY